MSNRRMASMDLQLHEKVYVAAGNDFNEGVLTLKWAIRKWGSDPITVVILHADSPMEFVKTPFGKLPPSAVSEKILELARKGQLEEVDRMLSKYIVNCGKVKAEIHKVKEYDEPVHYTLVELIKELRITKLVMAMTFMNASSGRSQDAISGSFYVHQNKPDFCDLYMLHGGSLVYINDENDGVMKNERGDIIANMNEKGSLKGWLERVLIQKSPSSSVSSSPRSMGSMSPRNQWDLYGQEIEEYFQQLLKLKDDDVLEENVPWENSPVAPNTLAEYINNGTVTIEDVKIQIKEAQDLIQLKKNETKAEVEKKARAIWAIRLCDQRAEELEVLRIREVSAQNDLLKQLKDTKAQLDKEYADIQERKSKLSAMLELQFELSSKLQELSFAKSCTEAKLETAAKETVEVIREIEEFGKQIDILHRRIEFCKEKHAVGTATSRTSGVHSWSYKEFTADEIRLATDDFAESSRLRSADDWTSVYKGMINHSSVAVMMPVFVLPDQIFQDKVNLLVSIRHPNVTAFLGFCSELKAFVFEYMHNGCLRDTLFSRSRELRWHHRLHIAANVGSAIGFLHQAEPQPIVHGSLNPSNIFLDNNLLAKINALALSVSTDELDLQTDVDDFGTLLLQLLCGRNWAELGREEIMTEKAAILKRALDDSAGEWPFSLAEAVVDLALKCLSISNAGHHSGFTMASVMKEIDIMRRNVDELVSVGEFETEDDTINVPNIFICPLSQEVVRNPHTAADGFSYELEAIEEWLRKGNDTSPVTKSKLNHMNLVPNHALRGLIQHWQRTPSD